MKNKWLFIIGVIALAVLSSFIVSNNLKDKPVEYGKSQFKIIDANTKEQIDNVKVIITDLEEEYIITKENNQIALPKKPYDCYATNECTNKGKFPYGYTTITVADGYLPRIDHNLILGYEDRQIIIELLSVKDAGSRSHYYEEYFHKGSPNIIYELLNHYNIKT